MCIMYVCFSNECLNMCTTICILLLKRERLFQLFQVIKGSEIYSLVNLWTYKSVISHQLFLNKNDHKNIFVFWALSSKSFESESLWIHQEKYYLFVCFSKAVICTDQSLYSESRGEYLCPLSRKCKQKK